MRLPPTVALCAVALAAAAAEPPIVREGPWWVQTSMGKVVLPGGPLKVHMRGPVTVRGLAGITAADYVLRKRVRAASESEARRLMGELVLRTGTVAGAGAVTLTYPHRPRAGAELEISVP